MSCEIGFDYDNLGLKGGIAMDTRKIGEFLKELRKEKDLTQEQLAEKILVSGRTVSRWETGVNMPDISLLVILAEFYDVSITEIIDGERKSEKMNNEVKETALKLSDYAEVINQKIRVKYFWLTLVALIGMIVFIVIEATGMDLPGSVYEKLATAGLGLDFAILIILAVYLSGIMGKVKAEKTMQVNNKRNTIISQIGFGILDCLLGGIFVLFHVNDLSGYIFLSSGVMILIYSVVKYTFDAR